MKNWFSKHYQMVAIFAALFLAALPGYHQALTEKLGEGEIDHIYYEESFEGSGNVTATENFTYTEIPSIRQARAYIKSTGIPDHEYIKGVYDCTQFARDLDRRFHSDNIDGGMALIYIVNGDSTSVHRTNFITIGNITCQASAQTGKVVEEWYGGIVIKAD